MKIRTEKEYCDRCGAEIPPLRHDNVNTWFPMRKKIGYVKFLALPKRLYKDNPKIYDATRDEYNYEILCVKCAEEFVKWWEEKDVRR